MRGKWFLHATIMRFMRWSFCDIIVIWCRKWAVGEKCLYIEKKLLDIENETEKYHGAIE